MNNNFPKGFLIFTCLIIIFSAMKFAQQLVVPFLLAIFISFICAPPLNYLNSKRIPPVMSVSIIIIFLRPPGTHNEKKNTDMTIFIII